jgi:hypothetical protein
MLTSKLDIFTQLRSHLCRLNLIFFPIEKWQVFKKSPNDGIKWQKSEIWSGWGMTIRKDGYGKIVTMVVDGYGKRSL